MMFLGIMFLCFEGYVGFRFRFVCSKDGAAAIFLDSDQDWLKG